MITEAGKRILEGLYEAYERVKSGTEIKYLFAKDIKHAITSAEIDYEWKRVDHLMFVDNKGYPVKIISDPEYLRGRPKGITVYTGYNYWENKNFNMFCELENMGRINMETPEYGPAKLKWLEERDKK